MRQLKLTKRGFTRTTLPVLVMTWAKGDKGTAGMAGSEVPGIKVTVGPPLGAGIIVPVDAGIGAPPAAGSGVPCGGCDAVVVSGGTVVEAG